MDTMRAYGKALAAEARGEKHKVFDWHKAARLIRERKPSEASAGLSGDWEYTGGPIYRDGAPVPQDATYVYLASLWATPELEMDGTTVSCLCDGDPPEGWDAHTYWPESALAILRADPPNGEERKDVSK